MRLMLGLLVVAALAACGPAALKDEDRAAMRAAADSFNAYFRSNNDSAIAGLFAELAIFMPTNMGPVEGRPAILAFFQAAPAIPDFTHTPVEIDGRGDLAYVRGTYSYSVPAQGGTPAMQDHGKYLEIRRRQADGRWLVTLDIFNSDLPAQSGSK